MHGRLCMATDLAIIGTLQTSKLQQTDRQTDRQNDKTTTVTLAAHARRGLMKGTKMLTPGAGH